MTLSPIAEALWLEFKTINNSFKSQFRLAKAAHFKDLISKNSTSSTKLWSHINPLINPNKKLITKSTDIIHGDKFNSPKEIANIFSNYFDSILNKFTFLAVIICIDYIEKIFNSSASIVAQLSILKKKQKFELKPITETDLAYFFSKLDKLSAAGISEIECSLIKHCEEALTKPLVILFNLCIKSGKIPDEWKISFVTPIPKPKTNKALIENYRPISVISPIAKLFEMCIDTQIRDYFESNNLLHDNQFGFRKNRSCELALNTILNSWRQHLDNHLNLIAAFLDLSKAFGTVDHQLLIRKT